jgi:uncharacterized protein YneR
MIRMGDFNGDGLPDFLISETDDADWYFALNQGNGKFEKKIACTLPDMYNQSSNDRDDDKFDCQVVDFNYDGKSDVVITKGKSVKRKDITGPWCAFESATTKWLRSTGSRLTEYQSVTSRNEHDAYGKYIVSGDFTGDGKVEIINYGRDLNGSGTDRMWRRYNHNLTAGSGMVSSVTDGFGNITKISYSGLAEKSACTKGTGARYPLADTTNTETDFDQNKTTVRYEYDDGVLLKESTFFDDDMKMYREVGYSGFTYAGGIFPNKPQRITVTQKHADDPNSFVQETSVWYHTEKGYVTLKKENPGTEKELTTVYSGRDIYGNVTQWNVNLSRWKENSIYHEME